MICGRVWQCYGHRHDNDNYLEIDNESIWIIFNAINFQYIYFFSHTVNYFKFQRNFLMFLNILDPLNILKEQSLQIIPLELILVAFIGVTLVHKTIQVSSVQLSKSSSRHGIMCPSPQVEFLSIPSILCLLTSTYTLCTYVLCVCVI